jgi:hypothetical protein
VPASRNRRADTGFAIDSLRRTTGTDTARLRAMTEPDWAALAACLVQQWRREVANQDPLLVLSELCLHPNVVRAGPGDPHRLQIARLVLPVALPSVEVGKPLPCFREVIHKCVRLADDIAGDRLQVTLYLQGLLSRAWLYGLHQPDLGDLVNKRLRRADWSDRYTDRAIASFGITPAADLVASAFTAVGLMYGPTAAGTLWDGLVAPSEWVVTSAWQTHFCDALRSVQGVAVTLADTTAVPPGLRRVVLTWHRQQSPCYYPYMDLVAAACALLFADAFVPVTRTLLYTTGQLPGALQTLLKRQHPAVHLCLKPVHGVVHHGVGNNHHGGPDVGRATHAEESVENGRVTEPAA